MIAKRTSKCKICRADYVKRSTMQKVCSVDCSMILIAKDKKHKEAKDDKVKRESLKSIPELKAEAQVIFNKFIRLRDEAWPCICCGKWNKTSALTGGEFDAGHYKSRGSADHLRFNENNVHKQLKNCNRYASGNAVEYRIGLIKRIGLEAVEKLEADQTIVKWTREMLLEIKCIYREKIKVLLKSK